jgi:hypothetical protein
MRRIVVLFCFLMVITLSACQPQPSYITPGVVSTNSSASNDSGGLWTLAAPQTRTPSQASPGTITPTPSNTPTFDQLWAMNYLLDYSTSDLRIEILRAEAGLKEYFPIWRKYFDLYRRSANIKTYFALWARITNKTGYKAFLDLYGCSTELSGEPYFFNKYTPYIIGDEWSSDIQPHGSILGGMVMLFGSRLPTGITSFSFTCPPPMVHGVDLTEKIVFSVSFDKPGWVAPPEELLEFYDIEDCCEGMYIPGSETDTPNP